MTDQEVLAFLAEKLEADGGYAAVARSLNVQPQVLHNWRARGLSKSENRYDVWHLANVHGAKLPVSWLRTSAAA